MRDNVINAGTNPGLDELAADAKVRIAACASLADLEALKVEFFGKKGTITAQLKTLGTLAHEERKAVGARINAVRDELGAVIEARKAELDRAELEQKLAAGRISREFRLSMDAFPDPAASRLNSTKLRSG